ncbi:amidohydrolase [Fulvivirga lutea]|uniref:Amidohydrolase n=1 Tax=Fulvivirga lutea TaxID=2810512 RepID=A0A974WDJ2_9BACT|nr:amidohydrolase [Fulvivirga lutea]QSE96088.1 amidohydrolase [Fulvivirga lutea]
MNLRHAFSLSLLIIGLYSCTTSDEKQYADTIYTNGNIYTADSSNSMVEAVAVKNGRIIATGQLAEVNKLKDNSTQSVDLNGATMTPGFIEGHGHLMGLGFNQLDVDLLAVRSYDELIEKIKEAVAKSQPGDWIQGRGWHQDKWNNEGLELIKGFPVHDRLSEISPDNPVFLKHASGHAALANYKAMQLAGVLPMSTESMKNLNVEGAEIVRDEQGNPTGVFIEPAAYELISDQITKNSTARYEKALELAIEASHKNGITGFHTAGIHPDTVDLFYKFKNDGRLKLRLYAMLSGWNRNLLNEWYEKGPDIDTTDYLLTIRSVKLNCDGALGSRGAWLLEEYTDRPGHYGHETLPMEFVYETAKNGLANGFQVCAHAIGDRANKEILDRYEKAFAEFPDVKDHRFRIEHAQHLHPEDIPRFGELNVIPAMQAIHMSSDRPWAIDRLGQKRIDEGAYMWRALIDSGAIIVNGTDVPVEPVDPLASFYASVTRKTLAGTPEGGYEPTQKMTREEALKSYTINAAYGAFQEDALGSIEVGKLADFTVFDKDIMTIPEDEILKTKVIKTIFGGEVVYENN